MDDPSITKKKTFGQQQILYDKSVEREREREQKKTDGRLMIKVEKIFI